MKTTEICEQIAAPMIASMGFELCDVTFQKEYGDWVLTFYIDKQDGVTIDDCEAVSKAIDPLLDEYDPIDQEYVLSVSSLGIDRPLKKDRDFERAMGKELQIKLYAPLEKKKEWILFVKTKSYTSRSMSTFKADEMTVLVDNLKKAKEMIAEKTK